ncbi:MAG: hypothetical protein ACK4Z0_06320, partial [Sphingomonadaceae bacterium]
MAARAGGEGGDLVAQQEMRGDHVDTNCWFVTRPAFSLLTVWLMPVGLSPIGDRILFEAARRKRLAVAVI